MNRRQKLVQKQFLNNEEKIIEQLDAIYGQSLKDVTDKVKLLEFKIGKLQEEYDWLDDKDPQKARIKSQIQSKIYQKQYQQQLQKQLDGILGQLRNNTYLTVSDYLDECYNDGFIGTIFDLHGQGIPLVMPIDQESMVRAIQLDSKISKGLYTRLGEDTDMLKRKIAAQISRGISTGMSFQQVAQQLAGETRVRYNNAIRIARTEGHRIQTTAAMDAMQTAKDKGADVVKQWDAALDARTRESHAMVDGEIRELDKPFSNGLDFPGDPSGGASEVINCRCAILQRARWALDEDELETLKERAKYYGLDNSNEFDDFKKKYLKAVVPVPETPVQKCKNFNDLKRYMNNKYGIVVDDSVGMLNFESVKEAAQGIERVLIEFPKARSSIKRLSIGANADGLMDTTYKGSIRFNRQYYADRKTAVKKTKSTGYYHKNSDVKSIGSHEAGHILEKALIDKNCVPYSNLANVAWRDCTYADDIISKAYKAVKQSGGSDKTLAVLKREISGYARETSSECLAEAVADYCVNGENAATLSKEIWKILKGKLG